MKYFEAIEMIWDGGQAYKKYESQYIYRFQPFEGGSDVLHIRAPGPVGTMEWQPLFYFYKWYLTDTDWIVEKDGVVYEEYKYQCNCPWPNYADEMKCTSVCLKCNYPREFFLESLKNVESLKALESLNNQDPPAKLEKTEKHWDEIKMPIIADEVNEEWLEKKMLCFMKRVYLRGGVHAMMGSDADGNERIYSKCMAEKCSFCFPIDETQDTPKEEKREKVTWENLKYLIWYYVDTVELHRKSIVDENPVTAEENLRARQNAFDELKQKLEYLVSLQGEQ